MWARLKAGLIDDLDQAYKFWSVRLGVIATALQALLTWWPDAGLTLWNSMPGEVKDVLPQGVVTSLPLFLFAAAMVARVVKQDTSSGSA